MALYDTVRDLPLVVEGYTLDGHEYVVSPTFTRKTTVIRLTGGGEEGLGEDVTYDGAEQEAQQARGPVLPLAGEWTIDSLSRHLETLPLFASAPERDVYVDYRRWAFESAALDLALRQAGRSLGETVGREPRPVTFVASGGLGDPPSTARLRSFLALYPGLRFKLDARPDWTDEIFDELQALECVDSVDLKGQYTGTVVDNPPDPDLYRRVIEAFPDAWIEDPALTPETEATARAARRSRHLGRGDPLRRRHRGASLAAPHGQRQAVQVRLDRAAVRRVRALRGTRDRRIRRRPVGARRRARAHPAPGGALPSRHAERRRSRWLQRVGAAARSADEPAHDRGARDGVPPRLGLNEAARSIIVRVSRRPRRER